MDQFDVDRDLLAAMLAVHNGLLDRDTCLALVREWAADRSMALGHHLVERRAIGPEAYALMEGLAVSLTGRDDLPKGEVSAILSDLGSLRDELARLADPEFAAILHPLESTLQDDPQPSAQDAGQDPFATSVSCASEEDPYLTRPPSSSESFSPPLRSERGGARFRILKSHARGGLGEVFLAEDSELGREVALKEIRDRHVDDPESRYRFVSEAVITGRLEHPGVVPVYALGYHEDDRPYYAMRFIRGDTLKEAIAHYHAQLETGPKPLELRGLLGRFVDVCNTIAYAHSRGILHRDLKPANVMLGPYGETLVVDWGLAKATGSVFEHGTSPGPQAMASKVSGSSEGALTLSSEHDSSETVAGVAIGTPQYMSPEQAAGELHRFGPAIDIYSLGATLYTLLTGQAPFEVDRLDQVLDLVRKGEFPRPRRRNPAIASALEAICLKAMALKPEDRYPSARHLARDIESWLANEPVSAYREPWTARARRWISRHRTAATATGVAALFILAAVLYKVNEIQDRIDRQLTEADGRLEALLTAEIRAIPSIIDQLGDQRSLIRPRLENLTGSGRTDQDHGHLVASLALLQDDHEQAEFLTDVILRPTTKADEILVIRDALVEYAPLNSTVLRLRSALANIDAEMKDRELHACAALSKMIPDDPVWPTLADRLALSLVRRNSLNLGTWREIFQPVAQKLAEPLRRIYADRTSDLPERRDHAFGLLLQFASQKQDRERVSDLVTLIGDSNADSFLKITEHLKDAPARRSLAVDLLAKMILEDGRADLDRSRRQGRWAMALMKFGQSDRVWPLFRHRDDPSLRAELIHNLARFDVDSSAVIRRLLDEPDASTRYALMLCLAEYPDSSLSVSDRETLPEKLLEWYRTDPNPGIHGATRWLLERWDLRNGIAGIDRELANPTPRKDRDWCVNGQGQTFTVIRGPSEFLMGSPETASPRQPDEVTHRVRIDRTYAIASREVTVAEYGRFLDDPANAQLFRPDRHEQIRAYLPSPDCPIAAVDWYDCARYCNWLSKMEGLPESQWCYPTDIPIEITAKTRLKLPEDYLSRTGYRLPTEAEWEFACRASSVTARPFGDSEEWLSRYAWFSQNAGLRTHPVGELRPNDFGLFDMLGNTYEWQQDAYEPYAIGKNREPIRDSEIRAPVSIDRIRLLRGGVFYFPASGVRSAARDWIFPTNRDTLFGFRIVRTCP